MSLPSNFDNPKEYFEFGTAFFKQYQHLFNFPNTDILVLNILDRINIKNLENVDVFDKDFQLPALANGDEITTHFFDNLESFKVYYEDFVERELEFKAEVPLSPKKRHEIVHLAKEVANACKEAGCSVVVDFGSGLGYLDQLLFETTHCKILGLECKDSHYVSAKKRQRKYHSDSLQNVKYIKHMIAENSDRNIKEFLKDKFNDSNGFCITGLHSCADLTIDAINIFIKMADAKAMVLMPCCYHKMEINSETNKHKNFPLSNCLKDAFDKENGGEFATVPFLRLAAQPPEIEDNLEDLVFNLLARAVLQLYAFKHNCRLKRKKRKAVKLKTMKNDFNSYVKDATTSGFTLLSNNESYSDSDKGGENTMTNIEHFDLSELESMWREASQSLTFKKAAVFIILQNYLQPVIEQFVFYDRIVYLKENGIENCRFKKIFNETISPRCLCLFALK